MQIENLLKQPLLPEKKRFISKTSVSRTGEDRAPIKSIIHAIDCISDPQSKRAASCLLLNRKFFQRCRYSSEQQQWLEFFNVVLQRGDLPANYFVGCLGVLETPALKKVVQIYFKHANYIQAPHNYTSSTVSAQVIQLLESKRVILYLADAQIKQLVKLLSNAHFSQFLSSPALEDWLIKRAREQDFPRIRVLKW